MKEGGRLLKIALWFAATVAVLVTMVLLWRPFRIDTYLLPVEMSYGWIVIDYNQEHCPALPRTWFGYRFEIPEFGYLCTSSPPNHEWTYFRFVLVDKGGQVSERLRIGDWIHRHGGILEGPVELEQGELFFGPEMAAETFWYGPKDTVQGNAQEKLKLWRSEHVE